MRCFCVIRHTLLYRAIVGRAVFLFVIHRSTTSSGKTGEEVLRGPQWGKEMRRGEGDSRGVNPKYDEAWL